MTVTTSIDPARLLKEHLAHARPDLLSELLSTFINTLLSFEADSVCGAGYGQVSPGHTKAPDGQLLPEWLLQRRGRAERALTSVIATFCLLSVSTRRMGKLVQSLGIRVLSKSQVP